MASCFYTQMRYFQTAMIPISVKTIGKQRFEAQYRFCLSDERIFVMKNYCVEFVGVSFEVTYIINLSMELR